MSFENIGVDKIFRAVSWKFSITKRYIACLDSSLHMTTEKSLDILNSQQKPAYFLTMQKCIVVCSLNSDHILDSERASSVVGHVDVQPCSSVPHAECSLSQQPGCVTQKDHWKKKKRSSKAGSSDTGYNLPDSTN